MLWLCYNQLNLLFITILRRLSFMKYLYVLLLCIFCIVANAQKHVYPFAKQDSVIDDYFGTTVSDPYRWLETDSISTAKWVEAQQKLSDNLLLKAENKYDLTTKLKYYGYQDFPVLYKSGSYYFEFITPRYGLPTKVYIRKKPKQYGILALDLQDYKSNKRDRVSLGGYQVSNDDKYLAYGLSHNGSDWREIRFRHLFPFRDEKDILKDVKFSNIKWYKDGVFYIRYPVPETDRLKAKSLNPRIYYHKLGTSQQEDVLVYENKDCAECYLGFNVISKEKYLIVYDSRANSVGSNKVLYADLYKSFSLDTLIQETQDAEYWVIGEHGDNFFVQTNMGAPTFRVLSFKKGEKNTATEIIPQYKDVLEGVYPIGDKLLAVYTNNLDYTITLMDAQGNVLNNIQFPPGSSIDYVENEWSDSIVRFSYNSFLHPTIVYEYNINSFKLSLVDKTLIAYNDNLLETQKVQYTSKDGTVIPMVLAYKKNVKKNGDIPVILYGYGGYGTIMTPFFSGTFIAHMMAGGIVALPAIRGGGEMGEEWHKAGMKGNKQSVFDDFIAAAEFLVKDGYTNPQKLAIMGGSNGGLLVAAVINQRPDICKVAIAENGVYDMLRYQNYTIGHAWQKEYGISTDKDDFINLYKYSPIHNIKKGKLSCSFNF